LNSAHGEKKSLKLLFAVPERASAAENHTAGKIFFKNERINCGASLHPGCTSLRTQTSNESERDIHIKEREAIQTHYRKEGIQDQENERESLSGRVQICG
jgi:hypothetical protein